jgi:dTDP-4-dehydrorhamnose 3,5-epimerase-like enzyme
MSLPPHDGSGPALIRGDLFADDRGQLSFVNDFSFEQVKRFYVVTNHRLGFVRAWHGHKLEGKYVTVLQGSALVAAVKIDRWDHPSKDAVVDRFVLSAAKPAVLSIPPGYANGFMTLTDDAILQFFSTATLEQSKHDDFRYDSRYWDVWNVVER